MLEIYLRDNGKGFESSKSYTGNGLLGMKSRADIMQAELTIKSSAGEGSLVFLRLNIE